MASKDQIKYDIDRLFSDRTVTKEITRNRLEDIIDHIEILVDSLSEGDDDEDDSEVGTVWDYENESDSNGDQR